MASADLLDRFLIVRVILTTEFYILEESGLRFRRHVIRAQVEAKGRVRPAIRPETSLSGRRILRQPVAPGVFLMAGVAPGPYPGCLVQ